MEKEVLFKEIMKFSKGHANPSEIMDFLENIHSDGTERNYFIKSEFNAKEKYLRVTINNNGLESHVDVKIEKDMACIEDFIYGVNCLIKLFSKVPGQSSDV